MPDRLKMIKGIIFSFHEETPMKKPKVRSRSRPIRKTSRVGIDSTFPSTTIVPEVWRRRRGTPIPRLPK